MSAAITAAVVGGYIAYQSSDNAADKQAGAIDRASASADASARLSYDLGKQQLDFAKQQYDENAPLARRVTESQLGYMDQTAAQGQDYFDYMKTFRPVEERMRDQSLRDRTAEIAAFDAANRADAALLTGGNQGIYDRYRTDIEGDVNRAIADTQGGYTRSINQAIRQGLRYGGAGSMLTSDMGDLATMQASNIAAAANGTRNAGIEQGRQRIAGGMQMRQSNMNAVNQQEAVDWARMLDAAGLVRGLPGASAGAYGMANSSGNNAVMNSQVPGNAYMEGLSRGANTIASGANTATNTALQIAGISDPRAELGVSVGSSIMGAGTTYALKKWGG